MIHQLFQISFLILICLQWSLLHQLFLMMILKRFYQSFKLVLAGGFDPAREKTFKEADEGLKPKLDAAGHEIVYHKLKVAPDNYTPSQLAYFKKFRNKSIVIKPIPPSSFQKIDPEDVEMFTDYEKWSKPNDSKFISLNSIKDSIDDSPNSPLK